MVQSTTAIETAAETAEAEKEETEGKAAPASLETFHPYLEFLQSCRDEVFGAQYSEENTYEVINQASCYIHDVSNYSTIAEVMSGLEVYMTPELAQKFEESVQVNFSEQGDGLKLLRYERGYGEQQMVIDSAEISELSETACTVSVPNEAFEEANGTVVVKFVLQDGLWKMSEYTFQE